MGTTTYRLPDGFTVSAEGEGDSTWNGFPVVILGKHEYVRLVEHVGSDYAAQYVNDGKVTSGFYCDGLAWEYADED